MEHAPSSQSSRHGFVLTRHWHESAEGTRVTLWLATDDGPLQVELAAHDSVAFVAQQHRQAVSEIIADAPGVTLRPLALKDFSQRPVDGLYARSYRALLQLSERLRRAGIEVYEEDVRPPERYLMERMITAGVECSGTPDTQRRWLNARLRPANDYRPPLKMASIDIETSPKGELYSIGIDGCGQRLVLMLGPPTAETSPVDFTLRFCASRAELLHEFVGWVREHDPDLIVGWNLIQFDLKVLERSARQYQVPLTLGRDGSRLRLRQASDTDQRLFASIVGRLVIDGIEALRSAYWHFASFSLEHVAQQLLGEGKAIATPYQRLDEIVRMFREDKSALARYNLKDCELVSQILAHTDVVAFLLEKAAVTGNEADRNGGSVAAFSHLYLPRLHRLGLVAPHRGQQPSEASPGGYVMDSRPGLYDSVLVLDYKSLYPSIIRTFLIDPAGLVEGLADPDNSATVEGFRGARFSRTQHALPAIIARLWEGREQAKASNNQHLSQAFKIIMNACYGVLGSPGCRFFDSRLAASITQRGHAIMQRTRAFIEATGVEVIYGDTDSLFVWLKHAHDHHSAMRIGQQLTRQVNQWWRETLAQEYGLESVLELQLECHFQRFLMPTIRGAEEGSKKRYAGLVSRADGSDSLVFKGLETVRSDWSPLAQSFQQQLYERVFRGQPCAELVCSFVARTRRGELDDLLVFRKRLRRPLSDYQRNVPPQVRAARRADEFNAAHGRPLQYQRGGWISYVMTVNGPEPLECCQSAMDYEFYIERQLAPVADAILPFVHMEFSALISDQLGLFG
ncbi:DNA polymerase II [Carnimonas bestiolae]|uniref:DNA polymerase II n=1 Tax=Carnimonas bestiolae TaxID=3402172 RepID=UPI003F4ACB72